MGNSWRNPEARCLYDRALALLAEIVQEAHDAPHPVGPIETGLLYRHANNVVWLATDILVLANEDRIAGPPILARAMLESVFILGAATSVDKFAPRKAVSELREFRKRAHALDLVDDSPEWVDLLMQGDAHIKRIQAQYGLDETDPPWTVSRCARESITTDFLRKEYFLLSQHTHSSTAGLLTRHTGSDSSLVHRTIIACLIIAAGFSAQLLPLAQPQEIIDKTSLLLRELTELQSSGVFDPIIP